MSKEKLTSQQYDIEAIRQIMTEGIQEQFDKREIAAILLYLQVVILDKCTLDNAIERFAIDVKPVHEDRGIEQWVTGEEYVLIPRQERMWISAAQSATITEKAISVIQKIAKRVLG